MAYTNRRVDRDGRWTGACHHETVDLRIGDRFPACSGCRRGISWHYVGPSATKRRPDPRQAASQWGDDEGWWPGKAR